MNWLTSRLIPEWKSAWKLASVWLAALVGTFSTVMIANQNFALSLLSYLPNGALRTVVALLIGAAVFVVPTITRLWAQKSNG